mgnify:CR=1 FL=1|tara:strand:+ start:2523 stop:3062 length:540 start_codon:yes stop_codon:yes gene_type:complete
MVKSRFLNLLKTKSIGGNTQASASELNNSADSVFLEPDNLQEILQIGHVNSAIMKSRQNGGLPKGSLSQLVSVTVSDSPTVLLQPTNEEVYQIQNITIKESSGSTATVTFALTDGSSSSQIGTFSAGANSEVSAYGPIMSSANAHNFSSVPFLVTSGVYLMGSRDNECSVLIHYHVLQS